MKKSRFTAAQIVAILRAAEKGEMPISELCRLHGVDETVTAVATADWTSSGKGQHEKGRVDVIGF